MHERAKSYQMINMHEQAVDDFTAVLRRNPTNAHAFFRRAFSLKALKVNFWFCPYGFFVLLLMTISCFFQKFAEAAEDFDMAKNLNPINPKLVVNYKKLKGVQCIVLCEPGEEPVFK